MRVWLGGGGRGVGCAWQASLDKPSSHVGPSGLVACPLPACSCWSLNQPHGMKGMASNHVVHCPLLPTPV